MSSLQKVPIHSVLFLDIETVPEVEYWKDLNPEKQKLWEKKTEFQREKEEVSAEDWFHERGGILAEFGKIVCISCGMITKNEKFRAKSFYSDNERELLLEFKELLDTHFFKPSSLLCAHNGKEFDFPFIARRMIINQINLPEVLDLHGKKPWQIPHLDTLELWKFGDYKHFTSVSLLANILNIPTPKDDIDGSQVAKVYYKDHDLERIKIYCEKDVLTVAQIFRKFRFESLVEVEEN